MACVITGKFNSPLAPESASPGSFGVTPVSDAPAPRSMPRPMLLKIEFWAMDVPLLLRTSTPAAMLLAMTLLTMVDVGANEATPANDPPQKPLPIDAPVAETPILLFLTSVS